MRTCENTRHRQLIDLAGLTAIVSESTQRQAPGSCIVRSERMAAHVAGPPIGRLCSHRLRDDILFVVIVSRREYTMNLIVVVIILLILFGGGGFYYGGPYVGGGLGTILLIVLIVLLLRG